MLLAISLVDTMGRRALLKRFVPLMGVCLAALAAAFGILEVCARARREGGGGGR